MGTAGLSEAQSIKARLYVLQHGDAVSKKENPDRPLSSKGLLDIQHLSKYLVEQDTGIRCIFHSGKLRAEETAQIIADSLEASIDPEKISGIGPNDNVVEFVDDEKLIQSLHMGNVLIVSHMPFVSNLCSTLLTESIAVKFDFTPGTLACLFYEYEEWSMEFMIHPDAF